MSEFARTEGHNSSTSFVRPSNTTAYAAGDVITSTGSPGDIMTFSGVTRGNKATAIVQEAILVSSANQSTKLDAELWVFDTAITMDADNAAFTPTDAELQTLVAVIPFSSSDWKVGDATAGADGNAINHAQNLSIVANSTKDTAKLYGVLVARNAYTPVSAETFFVRLKCLG